MVSNLEPDSTQQSQVHTNHLVGWPLPKYQGPARHKMSSPKLQWIYNLSSKCNVLKTPLLCVTSRQGLMHMLQLISSNQGCQSLHQLKKSAQDGKKSGWKKMTWKVGGSVTETHGDGRSYTLYRNQPAGALYLQSLCFSETLRCPCSFLFTF